MQKYVWNQSNLLAILDAIDWIWIDMNWSHVLLLMTSLPPLPNHPIHEMTRKILFTTTLKKEVAYGLNFLLSKTVVEVMWRWQYPNQQLDRKRNIEKPSIDQWNHTKILLRYSFLHDRGHNQIYQKKSLLTKQWRNQEDHHCVCKWHARQEVEFRAYSNFKKVLSKRSKTNK